MVTILPLGAYRPPDSGSPLHRALGSHTGSTCSLWFNQCPQDTSCVPSTMLEEGQTLERCPGPHSCPTCSSQGGVSRDPLTAGSGDRSGLARLVDSTIPVACVPRRACFREAVSRSPALPSLTKTPKASHCTSLSLVFLLPVREPDAGRHPLFSKLGSRLPFSGNK